MIFIFTTNTMPANLGNIFMINQCQWWRLYTEAADCRFYFTENAKPDRELAPKQCSPVAVNEYSKVTGFASNQTGSSSRHAAIIYLLYWNNIILQEKCHRSNWEKKYYFVAHSIVICIPWCVKLDTLDFRYVSKLMVQANIEGVCWCTYRNITP